MKGGWGGNGLDDGVGKGQSWGKGKGVGESLWLEKDGWWSRTLGVSGSGRWQGLLKDGVQQMLWV